MNILMIAATNFEIEPFLKVYDHVEVLITGVGAPSTMYYLTKKIRSKNYDVVIQGGLAGSFNDDILSGEVVLVRKDTFADLGILEKDALTTLFEAGLAKDEAPYRDGWLCNDHTVLQTTAYRVVNAITINTVSDNVEQSSRYIKKFSPDIESMEGAALHFICLKENVPFLQVRAISNEVGIRDKKLWRLSDAIGNLSLALQNIIHTIIEQ